MMALPRVLIVEDQVIIALDLQLLVEEQGYEVVGPVVRTNDARSLIAEQKIDAALVDFMLEDGEAHPLIELLMKRGIPFALCSGADGGQLGALYPNTLLVKKPYNPDDVRAAVSSLITAPV